MTGFGSLHQVADAFPPPIAASGHDPNQPAAYRIDRDVRDERFQPGGEFYPVIQLIFPGLDDEIAAHAEVWKNHFFALCAPMFLCVLQPSFAPRTSSQREKRWTAQETDVTGREFLQVLKFLRIVAVQDLALLQDDFPSFVILQKHPAFKHPLWCVLVLVAFERLKNIYVL